jgi:hypothetical protein
VTVSPDTEPQHFQSDGTVEAQITRLVHYAHAAVAEHRLDLVAGDLRQPARHRSWRHGLAKRRRFKPREQGLKLSVDQSNLLPLLSDFREQLGAVTAHVLRQFARVEHLFQKSEHLRFDGHLPLPHLRRFAR